jgi:hypothetical protein
MEAMSAANEPQKPRRSRAQTLTGVDKRTTLGKRIAELKALYIDALGGADALSPMMRLKVDEAAQLKALAERARGDYLRDGTGSLDDVVRIERKASAAERALRIVDKVRDTTPSLAEYLAANHGDEAA